MGSKGEILGRQRVSALGPKACHPRLPDLLQAVSPCKPWVFTVALHLPTAKRNAINALRRMGYPRAPNK
jgi:hypothetical protein